ncbi:hypothetical protein MMC30_001733 [Trapelia coarctata]|nr:hypothetical protein [Trapelia coarctata]
MNITLTPTFFSHREVELPDHWHWNDNDIKVTEDANGTQDNPVQIRGDPAIPQMTAEKAHVVAAVEQPDYEIEVKVKARKGFEEGEWSFRLDDSDVVFATAAEDLV